MSKIIVFLGSPRKNGYTARIIEEIIKGVKAKGAEIIEYDLNDDDIRGCQGCFRCRIHEGCFVNDYLQPMYEDLKNADGIIFGTSIYFNQISGQSKQWFDRMFPMLEGAHGPFSARYPGKKVVTVFAKGNNDKTVLQTAIPYVSDRFTGFGWEVIENILCTGTNFPEFELKDELLQQAFKIGERLAK